MAAIFIVRRGGEQRPAYVTPPVSEVSGAESATTGAPVERSLAAFSASPPSVPMATMHAPSTANNTMREPLVITQGRRLLLSRSCGEPVSASGCQPGGGALVLQATPV